MKNRFRLAALGWAIIAARSEPRTRWEKADPAQQGITPLEPKQLSIRNDPYNVDYDNDDCDQNNNGDDDGQRQQRRRLCLRFASSGKLVNGKSTTTTTTTTS